MIGIVDVGVGNVASVRNMLYRVRAKAELVSEPNRIHQYSKLILPGVGHFDAGMERLETSGFKAEIIEYSKNQDKHLLGICLGMQILFESSEEGSKNGLALIPGSLKSFEGRVPEDYPVPNIGWRKVRAIKPNPLLPEFTEGRFYFVHTYFLDADNSAAIGQTEYGVKFTSMVAHNNIFGVQFHPEKSHRYGKELLTNFSRL